MSLARRLLLAAAAALALGAPACEANPADMLDRLQPVPAATPPGTDMQQFPQLGNFQVAQGPGMPINPQLPSNYNFGQNGSPQIAQTSEGAMQRGRLEAAVTQAQGKEAGEFEHLSNLFGNLRSVVRQAEALEQAFTTDPANVGRQAGMKDQIAQVLGELPKKFEAVELQRAKLTAVLGDTKDRVAELASYMAKNGN